jgi:hypothetical protein
MRCQASDVQIHGNPPAYVAYRICVGTSRQLNRGPIPCGLSLGRYENIGLNAHVEGGPHSHQPIDTSLASEHLFFERNSRRGSPQCIERKQPLRRHLLPPGSGPRSKCANSQLPAIKALAMISLGSSMFILHFALHMSYFNPQPWHNEGPA